jgi:hypothetical protein
MVLFFLVAAVVGYASIKSQQNLLKTGTVGKGQVTNVHVEVTQHYNNGSTSTTTQTDVSYKLVGVSGYTDPVYTSVLGGDRSSDIQVGEDLPVVYNPSNPSINGLQEALQENSSPILLAVPLMFVLAPLIIVIVLFSRRHRSSKREQAIQELRS